MHFRESAIAGSLPMRVPMLTLWIPRPPPPLLSTRRRSRPAVHSVVMELGEPVCPWVCGARDRQHPRRLLGEGVSTMVSLAGRGAAADVAYGGGGCAQACHGTRIVVGGTRVDPLDAHSDRTLRATARGGGLMSASVESRPGAPHVSVAKHPISNSGAMARCAASVRTSPRAVAAASLRTAVDVRVPHPSAAPQARRAVTIHARESNQMPSVRPWAASVRASR
jgi:hypothetical protein